MKIAYLISWNLDHESGVLKKIENQISIWESLGSKVHLFIISTTTDLKFLPNSLQKITSVHHVSVKGNKLFRKVNYFLKINKEYKKIQKEIFNCNYDVVYFRQSMWFNFFEKLILNHKSIIEINSLDINEAKDYGFIAKCIYFYGRKKIVVASDAIIAISNEISESFKEFQKPIFTCSNGTFNEYEIKNKTIPNIANLIFVGTANQKWQGVDKLIINAKKLLPHKINIVGYSRESFLNEYPNIPIHENVHFYGKLGNKQLLLLYKEMHIGIGTLALHRKQMFEASPLKVREYIGNGLPVIYAYNDTDLDYYNENKLLLKIDNSENNIIENLNKIVIFINYAKGKNIENTIIQNLAMKNKEELKLNFIKKIVSADNI